MKYLLISLILSFSFACTPEQTESASSTPKDLPEQDKAQALVDAAILTHGGERYKNFELGFTFRDRLYTATRDYDGNFTYTRNFRDSANRPVSDVLNQDGFHRRISNKRVELPAKEAQAYENSVNSVLYFMLLPAGLNDPAVRKKYLGSTTLAGQPYEMVEVTFQEDGGGVDHQDVFVYWFHAQKHTMDYIGYSYETEGGGLRFRKAVNPRQIMGILFQDYVNYKAEVIPGRQVSELGALYEAGELDSLSSIISEGINITYP